MFRWYVINTYSGHENKVKANLEHRIVSMNQAPRFRRVVVPTEQVIETKDGQKVQAEKRVLPGYVLVNMDLNDEAWCVVRPIVCLSVSALAIEPTSVTSKPSRIQVIPRPMTTSQCQRLQGSRSSRFGMFVLTALPVAPPHLLPLQPARTAHPPRPRSAMGTMGIRRRRVRRAVATLSRPSAA